MVVVELLSDVLAWQVRVPDSCIPVLDRVDLNLLIECVLQRSNFVLLSETNSCLTVQIPSSICSPFQSQYIVGAGLPSPRQVKVRLSSKLGSFKICSPSSITARVEIPKIYVLPTFFTWNAKISIPLGTQNLLPLPVLMWIGLEEGTVLAESISRVETRSQYVWELFSWFGSTWISANPVYSSTTIWADEMVFQPTGGGTSPSATSNLYVWKSQPILFYRYLDCFCIVIWVSDSRERENYSIVVSYTCLYLSRNRKCWTWVLYE